MALIELKLPESLSRAFNIPISSPKRQQLKVLIKLLKKSRFTEFGQKYLFDEILLSRHPEKHFSKWSLLTIIVKYFMNGGTGHLMENPMFAGLVLLNSLR
jgi:hypothetical protein